MIDYRAFDFDFTGRIVALEVGRIILGIPETEFDEGEEIQASIFFIIILNRHSHQQDVVVLRDIEFLSDRDLVLRTADYRITHAMAAFILIQFRPGRLPARIPDGLVILNIDMEAILIQRQVVVAVARDPSQARILIKSIAAGGIRKQREELVAS